MDIFYLNSDPVKCAQEHCDSHIKTQCFEIGVLLSYAYRCRFDDEKTCSQIYSPNMNKDTTYYNWLRDSDDTYKWLIKLWHELFKEHEFRFGKEHVSKPLKAMFTTNFIKPRFNWVEKEDKMFRIPECQVPVKYQLDNNKKPINKPNVKCSVLNSYRNWYDNEFMDDFTKRELPAWSKALQPQPAPANPTYDEPEPVRRRAPRARPMAGYANNRTRANTPQQVFPNTWVQQVNNQVPDLAQIITDRAMEEMNQLAVYGNTIGVTRL